MEKISHCKRFKHFSPLLSNKHKSPEFIQLNSTGRPGLCWRKTGLDMLVISRTRSCTVKRKRHKQSLSPQPFCRSFEQGKPSLHSLSTPSSSKMAPLPWMSSWHRCQSLREQAGLAILQHLLKPFSGTSPLTNQVAVGLHTLNDHGVTPVGRHHSGY